MLLYIIYDLTISSETSSCLTAGSGGDHCLIAGSTGITAKRCDTIGIIGGMCGGGSNVTPGSAGCSILGGGGMCCCKNIYNAGGQLKSSAINVSSKQDYRL